MMDKDISVRRVVIHSRTAYSENTFDHYVFYKDKKLFDVSTWDRAMMISPENERMFALLCSVRYFCNRAFMQSNIHAIEHSDA